MPHDRPCPPLCSGPKAASKPSHQKQIPAKLTDATCPKTDGLSLHPTLTGDGDQKQHAHLYWEYTGQTAVRMKNWKAYQPKKGEWKLFDLSKDIEEKDDLSASHPDVLKELIALAKISHQAIKQGKIFDRELIQKDRQQAPHGRKPKEK